MTRIGFLVDQTLLQQEGKIRSANVFHEFMLGFQNHFDELVFISRVFDDIESFAASLPADPKNLQTPYVFPENVRVVRLPPYPNITSLFTKHAKSWPAINRILKETLPELDALWLNFGHPVSLRALQICEKHPQIKCAGVLRGFYSRDAKMRRKSSLVGSIAGATMTLLMDRFGKLANKRDVPCVAFGAETDRYLQDFGLKTISTRASLLKTEAIRRAKEEENPHLEVDIVTVSRLSPEKGMDILIEAIHEIKKRHGAAVSLRIVGTGAQLPLLQQMVDEYGLQEQVRFDGYVPFGHELLIRYANARIMAIPSRTEGLPNTATEAMALGCPVVATSVGGLPEAVGSCGTKGILVPPEDPAALAGVIWDLLQDGERQASMSSAAARAGAEFTMERQVATIAEAFEL